MALLKRILLSLILISICAETSSGQTDDVGSGRALYFDGIDDYIDLGDVYDDLNLPITISAWVFVDPSVTYALPIFNSQDNLPLYNGITFIVTSTSLSIQYGDGGGENNPAFRRGKGATLSNLAGRWIHVAAIMRDALDMDLFLNGVEIGGRYVGDSNSPISSLSPDDVAKIGYWRSNGENFLYKGQIDELRIWNRSLSISEIRQNMCRKLGVNEPGLIGHWTFDEISGNVLTDKSPNHFDGKLKGNPTHVYSGAPIGDESVFNYTSNWNGVEVQMQDGLDGVVALNVLGNPSGIQIYEVKDVPSQSNGLNLSIVEPPYFGVFVTSDDTDNVFDVKYKSDVCKFSTRHDNSISNWLKKGSTLSNVSQRTELIKEFGGGSLNINLGPDEETCLGEPILLSPLTDPTGSDFTWQDGSKQSTFQVLNFGVYWVNIKNGCSEGYDTIKITEMQLDSIKVPNVFTPNGDLLNQFFEIDSRIVGSSLSVFNRWGKLVYQSNSYQNDWAGSDLPTGVYFYRLVGECINEKKGVVSILR